MDPNLCGRSPRATSIHYVVSTIGGSRYLSSRLRLGVVTPRREKLPNYGTRL